MDPRRGADAAGAVLVVCWTFTERSRATSGLTMVVISRSMLVLRPSRRVPVNGGVSLAVLLLTLSQMAGVWGRGEQGIPRCTRNDSTSNSYDFSYLGRYF